ncbi:DinB family protein [Bacillus solimangrovi]|uniref:DinB family protein n=1 Tax=Bacillus solimangrovi TaxID=1305675 RepID=UPI000A512AAD|nr:DinB family protein [Bacillus solimangrovi]
MIDFFKYNWTVRDEWFTWCKQLTPEQLLMTRTGGIGNILHTLFHIVEVEYSWNRAIQEKEDSVLQFDDYHTLEKVKQLSYSCRNEITGFLQSDLTKLENETVIAAWDNTELSKVDILHHVIIHEIHHIGQLSIWARELNLEPVSASFINRTL